MTGDGHHIAHLELPPAAQLDLVVDPYQPSGDHRLGLRPRFDQIGQFQELPEPYGVIVDGHIDWIRHGLMLTPPVSAPSDRPGRIRPAIGTNRHNRHFTDILRHARNPITHFGQPRPRTGQYVRISGDLPLTRRYTARIRCGRAADWNSDVHAGTARPRSTRPARNTRTTRGDTARPGSRIGCFRDGLPGVECGAGVVGGTADPA